MAKKDVYLTPIPDPGSAKGLREDADYAKYSAPKGHDKHLSDTERAHSGQAGSKVRHGADATGKVSHDQHADRLYAAAYRADQQHEGSKKQTVQRVQRTLSNKLNDTGTINNPSDRLQHAIGMAQNSQSYLQKLIK